MSYDDMEQDMVAVHALACPVSSLRQEPFLIAILVLFSSQGRGPTTSSMPA